MIPFSKNPIGKGATLSASNVVYVVPNGTGDGSSWSNALGDIQQAINLASVLPDRQVWIKEGRYQNATLTTQNCPNPVQIFGSFDGTERSVERANYREGLRFYMFETIITMGVEIYGDSTVDGLVLESRVGYNTSFKILYSSAAKITRCIVRNSHNTETDTYRGECGFSIGEGCSFGVVINQCIVHDCSANGSILRVQGSGGEQDCFGVVFSNILIVRCKINNVQSLAAIIRPYTYGSGNIGIDFYHITVVDCVCQTFAAGQTGYGYFNMYNSVIYNTVSKLNLNSRQKKLYNILYSDPSGTFNRGFLLTENPFLYPDEDDYSPGIGSPLRNVELQLCERNIDVDMDGSPRNKITAAGAFIALDEWEHSGSGGN